MNGNNGWSRGLKVATILAVAWLLIWGIFAVGTALATPASPDEPTTPTGTGAPETESLVVTPDDLLPEQALCTSDVFLDHSLRKVKKGSDEHRWWSDAVSIPFQASAKEEVLDELFAEHCGNPTELTMTVQALWEITINEFNVGDHNPWMEEFLIKGGNEGLRSAFLTKKEDVEGIFVTAEYQHVAAMTNTLLLAFENKGFVKEKSLTNWHIDGVTAGELPRATLNPKQEKLEVLRLEFTAKGEGCLTAIGFNKYDKRFETLPCEKKPKPNPTPTATPTKPGFKPTKTPTPTPTKPTKTPKPSPTPTPSPKVSEDHPVPKGNAPSPSVPAPSVTEPASSPSTTPSATHKPAPAPEPTKSRTATPTQPAPPQSTASTTVDECAGGADNPACG